MRALTRDSGREALARGKIGWEAAASHGQARAGQSFRQHKSREPRPPAETTRRKGPGLPRRNDISRECWGGLWPSGARQVGTLRCAQARGKGRSGRKRAVANSGQYFWVSQMGSELTGSESIVAREIPMCFFGWTLQHPSQLLLAPRRTVSNAVQSESGLASRARAAQYIHPLSSLSSPVCFPFSPLLRLLLWSRTGVSLARRLILADVCPLPPSLPPSPSPPPPPHHHHHHPPCQSVAPSLTSHR
ncbi:unnamed protein product [Prorocentrum cordatum]|nr:unnamed protein product [Polarella glacialis]